MIYDCAVIGGGPAGMIAAIQLKRAGKNVILFEKNELGGLLRNANWVENYLGFPEGIPGKDLVQRFIRHFHVHNIPVIRTAVSAIEMGETLEVVTDTRYQTQSVIVATGTVPRKLDIPGETDSGRVFYEWADLVQDPHFSDWKTVLIIGGGDTGFDAALNFKDKEKTPTILTRGESCCLPLLKERAEKEAIAFHSHLDFKSIETTLTEVVVRCKDKDFSGDALLITIGRNPANIEANGWGEKEGLFFTGDVKNGINRHVQIATGDGLHTALQVLDFLK